MSYTLESKSQLAKLMATENIRVEHRSVHTAMFNLKERVLTCPVWKDMDGDLYDLLLGHEVGHALETPEQGWHNAILGEGKFNKNFKHFLNVVEDARIEKKIKRRFPGLKLSFIRGYNDLLARDFFGLEGRNINSMPFIDRLNLYTKCGVSLGINFSDEENELLKQVESCETWDDVVRVTEAVYAYSKEEQHEKKKQETNSLEEDYDDLEYEFSDYDEIDEDSFQKKQTNKSSDSKNESEDEEYGENEQSKSLLRDKESVAGSFEQADEPVCETDEAYRENETKLLDSSSLPYVYVNIPEPVMSEILTPYKTVHGKMEDYWYKKTSHSIADADQILKNFKNKNDRYVSLLAKEFEMRKSASKFSKQKVSETGDIDVSRIYKYQVDDNIFRKITKVPKGKSHGLVLLFDRSGSMQGNLEGTLEQIVVLSLFCRKVNIPFVVYGFGNEDSGFRNDHGRYAGPSFSKMKKQIDMDNVYLREYLNSNLSAKEFNRCIRNMVCLADSYGARYGRKFVTPNSEVLSNTPMIESIVALRNMTLDFKKKNNLDIVNTVVLHDGDADNICKYIAETGTITSFNYITQNVFVREEKTKYETKLKEQCNDNSLRIAIFDWYQKTTGSKIVGFYITGSSVGTVKFAIRGKYYDKNGKNFYETYYDMRKTDRYGADSFMEEKVKAAHSVLKTEKFLESNNPGYTKFFFVPGGNDLEIGDDELKVSEGASIAKVRNAFIAMNKRKQVSRVLVNRFIGEIAV